MIAAVSNTLAPRADAVASDLHRLRETTGKVVGSVFFGAMLKEMRESKLKGAFGHGGRGEEVFGAQLHSVLAEKAGEASHNGLADALFKHLARQQTLISSAHRTNGGTPS